MSKLIWAAVLAAIALLVASIVLETRLAAGVGAALLFVALIYGWFQNRRAGPSNVARAERGAKKLQAEIERDQTSA